MELFIPIVFFLVTGGVIAGFLLTRHRERMTMLDRGLAPEDIKQLYERSAGRFSPFSSLKWGILFLSVGLAVLVGMWLRESYYLPEGIYPALIALFAGTGLISFYLITRKKLAS
ncbi:MAG: hypothetical protein OEV30_08820 [Ignavibacteria bacterium]|nr:hypothetical protein [Ignavibacteria bacterium]